MAWYWFTPLLVAAERYLQAVNQKSDKIKWLKH
jgi:hypothetical protein